MREDVVQALVLWPMREAVIQAMGIWRGQRDRACDPDPDGRMVRLVLQDATVEELQEAARRLEARLRQHRADRPGEEVTNVSVS